jgi:hypothetical protein
VGLENRSILKRGAELDSDAVAASDEPDQGFTLNEEDLRAAAVRRIKKKREFVRSVVVYLLVNTGLWLIWAYDGADTDDLWPALVSGIWGVLLLFDLFKIHRDRPITDREIEEELNRLKAR